MNRKLYRCPIHGPWKGKPKSEWATHPSMGYAVCMTCRWQGRNGDLEEVIPRAATATEVQAVSPKPR